MKKALISKLINNPLFDHNFYSGLSSRVRLVQLIHYVEYGYKERLNPHPLFDTSYYIQENPDVAERDIEPLNHYLSHGFKEGRNPHYLFDNNYYLSINDDVRKSNTPPLLHFVKFGFREGRDPCRETELKLYLDLYPRLEDRTADIYRFIAWHYERKRTNALRLIKPRVYTPPIIFKQANNIDSPINSINVHCVYGPQHIRHLQNVLIPALQRSTRRRVNFSCLPYKPTDDPIGSGQIGSVSVIAAINPGQHYGFGEAHNAIYKQASPGECFIIINPDCIPQSGSIDYLVDRFISSQRKAGIVEGRQWPFEHPKEYDPLTLDTPWASGAFCLINSQMFEEIGGFDPTYFLYLEDVDLSWQSWLAGYNVIYDGNAVVTHFTGGRFYRDDLVESEKYYSLRNFLIISRKFFGQDGESLALSHLHAIKDNPLVTGAIKDYNDNFANDVGKTHPLVDHPKIKIHGFCQFHRMRFK